MPLSLYIHAYGRWWGMLKSADDALIFFFFVSSLFFISLYSKTMRISRMIVIHQLASVCVRSTLHQHRGLARGPDNRSRRGCATTIRTAVQSTARTAFPMEYFQKGLKYLPSHCIQPRRRTQTPADTHHLLRNRALLAHAFRDTKSVRARYWLKVIEFPT